MQSKDSPESSPKKDVDSKYVSGLTLSDVNGIDTKCGATYGANTVKELVEGKLTGGEEKVYGLKEDGVGIPESTKNLVPQDIIDYVNNYILIFIFKQYFFVHFLPFFN